MIIYENFSIEKLNNDVFLDINSVYNLGSYSQRMYLSQQNSWKYRLIKDYKVLPYFDLGLNAHEFYKWCS